MTSTEIEEFIAKFGEDAYKKIYNCAFNLGRKRRMDMKAPDKIYIRSQTNPNMLGGLWSGKSTKEATVPYIRKDALLEWLRERINLCDNSVAMKRAYEKLIENIQAL